MGFYQWPSPKKTLDSVFGLGLVNLTYNLPFKKENRGESSGNIDNFFIDFPKGGRRLTLPVVLVELTSILDFSLISSVLCLSIDHQANCVLFVLFQEI